jgi:hypothetical protein
MEEKHLHKIRVRRGTNSQRKQVLFEDGELVYINDIKRLYVGDLKTNGGIKTSNNNQIIPKKEKPVESDIGDILVNKLNKSVFIVDRDENLLQIMGSLDDYNKFKERLDVLEDLLNRLQVECCSLEFALDTDDSVPILADFGDWIKVKDPIVPSVVTCKSPIIASKYLKLKSNKNYTLDILNPNSDPDIVFFNNLTDRDTNDIPQNIKIVESSITTSTNIKVLETTDTTIKFSVDALPLGTSIGMGVFIDYNIQNECGSIQNEKGSIGGLVYNTNMSISSTKIDERKRYSSSRKDYNMYQIIDPITNEYPWEKEGWFLFYFVDWHSKIPAKFYITMVDRFPTVKDGIVNINKYYYGPISDSEGVYMFYHHKNTDLNIWATAMVDTIWSVFPIYNTTEHPKSPNRFFTDINVKPTMKHVRQMFNEKGGFLYAKDVTDIYKDTTTPSFIKIF